MKITMIQSFATPRGQLYQAGKEYEVDDAFGKSLVATNTASASGDDKPARVVQDLTESSRLDHALTRAKPERVTMDRAKSTKV
jgi:hypothetical protein